MKIMAMCFAALLTAAAAAAQSTDASVQQIVSSAGFKSATAFIDTDYDRFVSELITLTEIPAPSFKEQKRGSAYLEMLRGLGLSDVEMDTEGNVMGVRKGTGTGARPMLAVLAHLDTVFPEGTEIKVKREGTKLMAPGIGDDTRALALLLEIVRVMDAAKLQTTSDILFVGNVGEEGEGDLRGVKFLLQKGKYKGRIQRFISIDGGDPGPITNGALGSKRYRVTFKGPGGHSYGAFGLVSPAFAMASAMSRFSKLSVPTKPKTTFNVGVVGGGTSVNSIPTDMYMDVDMRSESPDELNKLVEQFHNLTRDAVDEENKARSTAEGKISVDIKLIGDRPSGATKTDSALVQAMSAVDKAFGLTPSLNIGSTDSNIPISMGIDAITIGRGPGGRSHSLDEWVDVEKKSSAKAAQVVLAVILTSAAGR